MDLTYINASGNTGRNHADTAQPFLVLRALVIPDVFKSRKKVQK